MDTVFLVGELALPFLCLSKRFLFPRYAQACARYHGICSTLLAKARMRGCKLRWPSDMVLGDQEVSAADRLKCFVKFEADARSEGADYEGEAKVFKVSDAEVDGGGVEPVVLAGFAYDIGPETCAALKAELEQKLSPTEQLEAHHLAMSRSEKPSRLPRRMRISRARSRRRKTRVAPTRSGDSSPLLS